MSQGKLKEKKREQERYEEFLFSYTSGRWLDHESDKVAEHYTTFNVGALKEVAARAGGAQLVTSVTKLAEGGFNKVLLLELNNGKQIIARIPMERTGYMEQIVTKSDVATMEYARTRLGLPLPRVLAWCAERRNNPVGSEYIIMEKAEGTELHRVWPRLDLRQKKAVVDQWVGIEKALLRCTSAGYGSICFKEDISTQSSYVYVDLFTDGEKEGEFVVGYHVGPDFWVDERRELDIDRGPWKTTLAYATAAARREIAWISKFAKPEKERSRFYPPAFDPGAHVALLERYLEVVPFFIPSDPCVARPALVYDDSSLANLFISEEKLAEGKIEISAVIDWSCTAIRPLFMAARWPKFAKHPEPHILFSGPRSNPDRTLDSPTRDLHPSLCNDNDELLDPQNDKEPRELHDYYGEACAERNPEYYRAMSFRNRELVEMMVDFSGRTWKDDLYAPLQACLAYASRHWSELAPRIPLPNSLRFTDHDLERIQNDTRAWQRSASNMTLLRNVLKIQDDDCWVHPNDFVRSAALNSQLKKGLVDMGRSDSQRNRLEKDWPFEPEDGNSLEVDTAR